MHVPRKKSVLTFRPQLRVAFTPSIFSLQQYGGISRYFYETAMHLSAMPDTEVTVLAHAHINAYLDASAAGCVVGHRIPLLPQPVRPLLAWFNHLLARRWLAQNGTDIVHETYYSAERSAPAGIPIVITVLDMIHEKFPNFARGTAKVVAIKRAAVSRADHIICISEHTRRDLLEVYDIDPARTSVVRLGFSLQLSGAIAAVKPVPKPYILYVGKRGGYKNFDTLLRAYAGIPVIQRSHILVCFGDAPLSATEVGLMAKLGVAPEHVRHLTGNDDRLASLYRHAALFVYPSRYEGFGIPPLEAMSFDCPVVCSNAASLPEVVGDAALTFDPNDVESLATAMKAVLYSHETAERLRERGRERVKLFSWDICAQQTRSVYASLMQEEAGPHPSGS